MTTKRLIRNGKCGALNEARSIVSPIRRVMSVRAPAFKAKGSWSRRILRSEGRAQARRVRGCYKPQQSRRCMNATPRPPIHTHTNKHTHTNEQTWPLALIFVRIVSVRYGKTLRAVLNVFFNCLLCFSCAFYLVVEYHAKHCQAQGTTNANYWNARIWSRKWPWM